MRKAVGAESLLGWIGIIGAVAISALILWRANGSDRRNLDRLCNTRFGPMFLGMGLESARCYANVDIAQQRTRWALSLQRSI